MTKFSILQMPTGNWGGRLAVGALHKRGTLFREQIPNGALILIFTLTCVHESATNLVISALHVDEEVENVIKSDVPDSTTPFSIIWHGVEAVEKGSQKSMFTVAETAVRYAGDVIFPAWAGLMDMPKAETANRPFTNFVFIEFTLQNFQRHAESSPAIDAVHQMENF